MAAVTGVESIELAPIGVNGAMPSSGWIKIVDIEMDSVNMNIPPLEKVRVRVEDKSGIRWVLPGETDPPTFAANSLNMAIDAANLLFKGLVTTSATEFKAPTTDEIHYLAIRFTSKPFEGKKFVLEIPVAAISAGIVNNFTKTGFVALSFSGDATTPSDASGNAVSAYGFKFENVPPVEIPEG